jgi:hypothetical protein
LQLSQFRGNLLVSGFGLLFQLSERGVLILDFIIDPRKLIFILLTHFARLELPNAGLKILGCLG